MRLLFSFLLAFITVQVFAQSPFIFRSIDLVTGDHSHPRYITSVGNKLYMRAELSAGDAQPWISDGTQSGTNVLKNIFPGSGSFPSDFTPLNGKVIFEARDGSTKQYVPWITDGTEAGTKQLSPTGPVKPDFFTPYNGKVYFAADGINGIELYSTDGTDTGTRLVKDILPSGSSAPWPYAEFNGKLYFGAYGGNEGKELWVTDGTAAGTQQVKDIYAGPVGSYPAGFAVLGSQLLFFAEDSAHGIELWKTNGTDTGTVMVKDIWPGRRSCVDNFYSTGIFNGYLYFTATDSVHGYELWKTNGTEAGTQMVTDLNPGESDGIGRSIFKPVAFKNKMYFAGYTDTTGNEVWSTDGTSAGTQQVADIFPGKGSSNPNSFIVYKNRLLFAANLTKTNAQVHYTDGTTEGTHMIMPKTGNYTDAVYSGWFYGFTYHAYDSSLYFAAQYNSLGVELWCIKDTSTTGIGNVSTKQHSFNLYPNPNNGSFTVDLDNNNFKEGKVEVYDMMGRQIHSQIIRHKSSVINLNAPKGIYLVKLQVDDNSSSRKILIE